MINLDLLEEYLCPLLGFYLPQKYFVQDSLSNEIVGLKTKDMLSICNLVIKSYAVLGQLKPLPDNLFIARVPGHLNTSEKTGVDLFIEKLLKMVEIGDGSSLLMRQSDVEKSTTGISRNENNHIATIGVSNIEQVRNRNFILIDDVRTSGASLNACAQILLNNGAKRVIKMPLVQTIKLSEKTSMLRNEDYLFNKIMNITNNLQFINSVDRTGKKWTDEEMNLLNVEFAKNPSLLRLSTLLNRSTNAIRGKLEAIGLIQKNPGIVNSGQKWSQMEIDQLRIEFETNTPLHVIAKNHRRTTNGIRLRLVKLGLLPE